MGKKKSLKACEMETKSSIAKTILLRRRVPRGSPRGYQELCWAVVSMTRI